MVVKPFLVFHMLRNVKQLSKQNILLGNKYVFSGIFSIICFGEKGEGEGIEIPSKRKLVSV